MDKPINTQKKVPAIRFQGFSGEWEERTLGDLSNIVRGASPRPIENPVWFDENSDIGWLRIRDVTEQNGRIYHLEQRISKAGEEKTRVLTEPHLLLSIAASVGKPVINYVSTGVHDGFLIFMKPVFQHEFLFQWLKYFEPEWQQYGQPGSQVNLNSEIVKNQIVSIPKPKEQTQIGDFFQALDDLIAKREQKHAKLGKIKQALLGKLFPQAGETVPQMRFIGFSGDWEEKTLGEITKITMGHSPSGKNYTKNPKDYILVQGNADMKNGFVFPRVWTTQITKMAYSGDLIFSVRAPVGEVGKTKFDIVIGRGVAAIKGNEFIFQYLLKMNKDGYWKKISAGSTFDSINTSNLSLATIKVTTHQEQTQIGNLFHKLDTLIDQYEQQITTLKNIKQGYLNKMFI